MANKILVPYRLESFGQNGWTVAEFENLQAAHTWAKQHSNAAMPCWHRTECWGGKELGK